MQVRARASPALPRQTPWAYLGDMRATTKLIVALVAAVGLAFSAVGVISEHEAGATPAVNVQQANPTITITNQAGGDPEYLYDPAELNAKVGQTITIINNDETGVHSVTAKDRSFNVDVPPKSSATLTVPKAGSFPYYCTYHPAQHNPATINVS